MADGASNKVIAESPSTPPSFMSPPFSQKLNADSRTEAVTAQLGLATLKHEVSLLLPSKRQNKKKGCPSCFRALRDRVEQPS